MVTTNNEAHVSRTATCAIQTNRLVVGYARSARGEASIARQQNLLNDFCERVYGRPLDAFYQDVSSGNSTERDGMAGLVKAAHEGEIGVVIIEDYDRIARNLGAILEFERWCERADIKILSLPADAGHARVDPLPAVDMASARASAMRERQRLGRARAKVLRAARG